MNSKTVWTAVFLAAAGPVGMIPPAATAGPTNPADPDRSGGELAFEPNSDAGVGSDPVVADLAAAHLYSATAWTPITTYGCNAVSFGAYPGLGDLYIGRLLNNTDPQNPCSGSYWSLVLARMDWRDRKIVYEKTILDTSRKPVLIGDGNTIRSAYDATVALWQGELWVAFECFGDGPDFYGVAGSCIGPLKTDLTINLSRTVVVVKGGSADAGDSYFYSGAVPKLLVYEDRLYLYWTAMQLKRSAIGARFNFTSDIGTVTTRGTLLGLDSTRKRLRAIRASGASVDHAIFANDPSSVEVFGLDPDDLTSNTTADLLQAMTVGSSIYLTGARGGGGCNTPHGTTSGCYRLTIGEATDPLEYHTFNQHLAPPNLLPDNPQEYYRFVYRPEDKRTVLLGGHFLNPHNVPGLPTGMTAAVWPTPLLSSAPLPADLAAAVRKYNPP